MSQLLDAAKNGRLVIFAGAGISVGPPTNLPSWREVNRLVVSALAGEAASLVGEDRAADAAKLVLTRHEHEKLPPEYQAQILAEFFTTATSRSCGIWIAIGRMRSI